MKQNRDVPKKSIAFRTTGVALSTAAALSLILGLPGEAQAFKLFGWSVFGEDEPEVDVIDPVRYTVQLETGTADAKLVEALNTASRLVQDKEQPASGDLGVVIKARDDRDRLIAALYENARYGGLVSITVNGTDLDALPPAPVFSRANPVSVVVRVDPGPAFTIGAISFTGDASRFSPADYGLVRGGDAGSLGIIRAGEKIVADLKAEGRPLARLVSRDVVADHETDTVSVAIEASGGPVANLGPVGVTGEKTVDGSFIRSYSLLNEGRPYTPEALKKAGQRLRQLGVFSSVTVREADALDENGRIPTSITVSEGKHRYFGFGAQFSTTDGAGLQGYWGHRNLFGKAESLRVEGAVSRLGETTDVRGLDYSAAILFSKPGAIFPAATFNASLRAKTEHPNTYEANSVTAAAGFSYEVNDLDTASVGTELSYADTTDVFGENQYLTFSAPLEYVRDARDDKLNPTEGYRASILAKPSYEILNKTFFTSFEGSLSGYVGFGAEDTVVLAGRVQLGSIVGGNDLAAIPATRRFYAGGGGSVRGYSYQEISPRDAAGNATGGLSYGTVSAEARVKITDTISIVPFADVGSVSAEAVPDFNDLRAGAGVGLRYATPFGPIRLDVALPLNPYDGGSRFGIYAGIGQAF